MGDVQTAMGTKDATSNTQLENYINSRPRLRKLFDGILLNPTDDAINAKVETMQNRHFIIILRDEHWTAVMRKKGKLIEFDSFGRDLLGPKYDDATNRPEQEMTESNCGQRTLNWIEKNIR